MALTLSKSLDAESKPAKSTYIGQEALSGEVAVDLSLIASTRWLATGSDNGKLELIDIDSPLRTADSLVIKMPVGFDMRRFKRGSEVDGETVAELIAAASDAGVLRVAVDSPLARYYELSIADNNYEGEE